MEKSAVGLMLVAALVGACSSTTYINNFASDGGDTDSEDDGAAAAKPAAVGDAGSDVDVAEDASADAADVDASTDAGTDSSAPTCTGELSNAQVSEDCNILEKCSECGVSNAYYYKCDAHSDFMPANAVCVPVGPPHSGAHCCIATCTRQASRDDNCPTNSPFAWQCANPKGDNSSFPGYPGCVGETYDGMTSSMCCKATVVPEWL